MGLLGLTKCIWCDVWVHDSERSRFVRRCHRWCVETALNRKTPMSPECSARRRYIVRRMKCADLRAVQEDNG
jgi:hypothetical protein